MRMPNLYIPLLLCCNSCGILPLAIYKVFPVECPYPVEFSGLTRYKKTFYTVSDNDDHTIFKLDMNRNSAVATPAIRFHAPPLPGPPRLDFEGIAVDSAGFFYLASERKAAILRVDSMGNSQWTTQPLIHIGYPHGLFRLKNAGLEGIVTTNGHQFLLCAERQSRGLLWVDTEKGEYKAVNMNDSKLSTRAGRTPDLSGLCHWDNRFFALARFAHCVCEIRTTGTGFTEGRCWSYAHIENHPRYRFRDRRYGIAEGLYIDNEYIYIIVDNNKDNRQSSPGDRRPLMYVLKNSIGTRR